MAYFTRTISQTLLNCAATFPAVLLTGARQTGKTTLLKELFPNHRYVSLDLPSLNHLAQHQSDLFLKQYKPPVVIDEVQYAPMLFRHLKIAIDEQRHTMGQFILSGSQKFALMNNISESLAGRCAVFELEGLSLEEIFAGNAKVTSQDASSVLFFIHRGSFPELWRDQNHDSTTFLHSYLTTYLERDVRQIINVGSLRDFERLIRAAAARNGQILDKASLASDVGVAAKTINSWLGILEASNQIILLEPWFMNFGKRLVKSPKIYFCDTGLLCNLLGVSIENLVHLPFIGAIWEAVIFAQIRKINVNLKQPWQVWYYKDQHGLEVDFMLTKGATAIFIECKWAESIEPRMEKPLAELKQRALNTTNGYFNRVKKAILCRTPHSYTTQNDTSIINLENLKDCLQDEN